MARILRRSGQDGRGCAFCCAPIRFARDELMGWCEANKVDYLFGLARNDRLVAAIASELPPPRRRRRSGRPARRFKDFMWTTLDSWSCQRRVVAKAE